MKKRCFLLFFLGMALIFNNLSGQVVANQAEVNKRKNILNEFNLTFSYGGESKIGLLFPKIEYLRIHQTKPLNIFYGASLGIHPILVSTYGSISSILGIEKKNFGLSTSIGFFKSPKVKINDNETSGPFSQSLINFKVGYKIKNYRIRIGRSLLISEIAPENQERISLLDIGSLNGKLWLIEFQTILKRK